MTLDELLSSDDPVTRQVARAFVRCGANPEPQLVTHLAELVKGARQ